MLKISGYTPRKPTRSERKFLAETAQTIGERYTKTLLQKQENTETAFKRWQEKNRKYVFNG